MHKIIVISLFVFGVSRTAHGVDIYWRDYDGTTPNDAFQTGHDVYIAQLTYKNVTMPGSFYPKSKQAVTEIAGRKFVQTSNFKIMCSREQTRFRWEHVNVSDLKDVFLDKCVKAGFEADSHLYIGKVFHQNEWKIGKVFPANSIWNGLRIWESKTDAGYYVYDFQILRAD